MTPVSPLARDRRKNSGAHDAAQQLVRLRLAELLKVLAHPQRLRIVQELDQQERNVGELQSRLRIASSGVSQHLGLLRAYRVVVERRAGRHVFYRLAQPELASWLHAALALLVSHSADAIAPATPPAAPKNSHLTPLGPPQSVKKP